MLLHVFHRVWEDASTAIDVVDQYREEIIDIDLDVCYNQRETHAHMLECEHDDDASVGRLQSQTSTLVDDINNSSMLPDGFLLCRGKRGEMSLAIRYIEDD